MTGSEYFITAQLLRRVQSKILNSNGYVQVKLPGYLKAVELIRQNKVIDL